jgi:hypothetical protein
MGVVVEVIEEIQAVAIVVEVQDAVLAIIEEVRAAVLAIREGSWVNTWYFPYNPTKHIFYILLFLLE